MDIMRWENEAKTPSQVVVSRSISDFLLGFTFEETAMECGLPENEYLEAFEQYYLVQSIFVKSIFSDDNSDLRNYAMSKTDSVTTLLPYSTVKVSKEAFLKVYRYDVLLLDKSQDTEDNEDTLSFYILTSCFPYYKYISYIENKFGRSVSNNENLYKHVTKQIKRWLYTVLISKTFPLDKDSQYKYVDVNIPHVSYEVLSRITSKYIEDARYVRDTTSLDLESRHNKTLEHLDLGEVTVFGKDPLGRTQKEFSNEKLTFKRRLFSNLHLMLHKLEGAL